MKLFIKKHIRKFIYILLGMALLYMFFGFILYLQLSTVPSGYRYPENSPAKFTLKEETFSSDVDIPVDTDLYAMETYQTVTFPSLDTHITLSAWYVPAQRESSVAIIIIPGYTQSKANYRQLMIAGLLHQYHYNVLILDLRNTGKSTVVTGRTAMGNEEFKDILGAKAWLIENGIKDIGLVGVSMGASTAAIAFSYDTEIKAALLDSPYTSVKNIMQEELARLHVPRFLWYSGYMVAKIFYRVDLLKHSPKELLVNNLGDRWLMLYHAKNDSRVNIAHSKAIYDVLLSTAKNLYTWFYDSEEHAKRMIFDASNYQQKMITFFDKAFSINRE